MIGVFILPGLPMILTFTINQGVVIQYRSLTSSIRFGMDQSYHHLFGPFDLSISEARLIMLQSIHSLFFHLKLVGFWSFSFSSSFLS